MDNQYILESTSCPLCGEDGGAPMITDAKEMYIGLQEYFSIKKCKRCDMAWTDPRPTPDTISYFYPDSAGYYTPENNIPNILDIQSRKFTSFLKSDLEYSHLDERKNLKPHWFLKQYLRRKSRLLHIPNWIHGGRLLDVGCSWGRYLKQMSFLGWEVYGVELNAVSVKHAQEQLGLLNVKQSQIEKLNYPPETFDVIHLSMVLEHLHNPKHILTELAQAIKSKGQLIVSVPDFSGIEFHIFGKFCYGLQVPQHLNHFTPQTATKMLNECGFRVESITHQAVDRDFIASLGYTNKYKFLQLILKNKYIRKYFMKTIVFVLALIGLTSRMSIYAKKTA